MNEPITVDDDRPPRCACGEEITDHDALLEHLAGKREEPDGRPHVQV